MLKQTYLPAAILLCCLANTKTMAVDTIADVKTLADLRAQSVIHLDNGWDVQIGMRDPDADAGPYKLIYCLAKAEKITAHDQTDGEFELGPVSVDLVDRRAMADKLRQTAAHLGFDGEQLFCQVLPVGWTDDLLVRVRHGEKTLLEKQLGKSDHRPFYWTQFASYHREKSDHQQAVVCTGPFAQCPSFDRWSSILRPWVKPDVAAAPPLAPVDAPLPGDGSLSEKWLRYFLPDSKSDKAIELKIENDQFVVHAADRILESPQQHLLARWWVNDVPVPAEPGDEGQQMIKEIAEQIIHADQLSISLGLPSFLGQLKVGDRIGLQLMYTPSFQRIGSRGTARLMKMQSAGRFGIGVPLLTNRLDFNIDEHLLSLVVK